MAGPLVPSIGDSMPIVTHGLAIRGISSWVGATIVVWLVTALATLLLPVLVIKRRAGSAK